MAKLKSTEGKVWAFMKVFNIPDATDPRRTYLRRWRLLQTPWFALYLHLIFLPDGQQLHDHPFNFWSLILKGGYREQRVDQRVGVPEPMYARSWRAGSFHHMPFTSFHRILKLDRTPTWTLVFVGRRRQEWGFLHPQGKVLHYNDPTWIAANKGQKAGKVGE